MKPHLHIAGMHGLGDNLHQRAVIRQLLTRHEIWLETPWPCVYHDLACPDLHLISKGSKLRTQAKNAAREADKFERAAPCDARKLTITYKPNRVRSSGSVLGAMMETAGCDIAHADFRLSVPDAWRARAPALLEMWDNPTKPIMIYRPLMDRSEWGGCKARNPDHAAYADLFASIRDRYFVVSVADLEPGKEWLVGPGVDADVRLHGGELDFETLAALTQMAGLVFSSPGFAVILAQSVGTPSVCIFGGYENGTSFSAGAHLAPHLTIEPINPCDCFSHDHACQKAIDLPRALSRLKEFTNETARHPAIASQHSAPRVSAVNQAIHEPRRA